MKIPWTPEGMQTISGDKGIDSKKENLQISMKQYKYQIEQMHEANDGLVTTNRRLREDLEEVNSHYQELIVVSREALKRKRQTEDQFTQLEQTIQELTQQNEELTRRVADLEADHLKARRKAQALEGIALLAEAAKDLQNQLRRVVTSQFGKSFYFCIMIVYIELFDREPKSSQDLVMQLFFEGTG